MKTKMELAHDWMMKHDDGSMSVEVVVFKAWQYADAMQAEADKREASCLAAQVGIDVNYDVKQQEVNDENRC